MNSEGVIRKKGLWYRISRQKELTLLSIPFFIYFSIFSYAPLWGLTMAFQNYKPQRSFSEQQWVGFKHFEKLFTDPDFYRVMRNTLSMSIINLVLGFVFAIAFALFLNELRGKTFKRFTQTVSYMPHFLSMIIVTGLVSNFLAMDGGIVNELLMKTGLIKEKIHFMGEPGYFWWIVGFTNVWKSMGWNSIIYLAAITSIDSTLYEAASIDGATWWKKVWHVTLPGIRTTIVLMAVMNLGNILNAGFDQVYNLYSASVYATGDILDTYVYRVGLQGLQYSFGTAVGLLKSVIAFVLMIGANKLAQKYTDSKIF